MKKILIIGIFLANSIFSSGESGNEKKLDTIVIEQNERITFEYSVTYFNDSVLCEITVLSSKNLPVACFFKNENILVGTDSTISYPDNFDKIKKAIIDYLKREYSWLL